MARTVRPPKNWPIDNLRECIEVLGMTHRQAGEKLGIPHKYISDLCKRHSIKTQRRGPRSGPGHPDWKGGVSVQDGYALVWNPCHPCARKNNYVLRSHLVMEKKIGRQLAPGEVVHHKDEDTLNDHPDNLVLYQTNKDHLQETLAGRVPNWTEEGRQNLRAAALRRTSNPGLLKQRVSEPDKIYARSQE